VSGETSLAGLIAALPEDLRERALRHSSWAEHRAESYGRLAFLGDSVLGLAVAEEIYRRFARGDIGRLTKVHGQAVSGRACAGVAEALGIPAMLTAAAPLASETGIDAASLVESERAMASILEAMIGACYLEHGYELTAAATAAAFEPEIELASETLLDFKSALQEELARSGTAVSYAVTGETGPAHERRFEVEATVGGEVLGQGSGRSKKAAEQAAAQRALERLTGGEERAAAEQA
jgi:ribonuclease-3